MREEFKKILREELDSARILREAREADEVRFLRESYEDVGLDYILNKAEKINHYTNYIKKKEVAGFTYLLFPENPYFLGQIKVFDSNDGTEVANSSFGRDYEGGPLLPTVDVRPDKRRKGIATEMYKWIEEITGEKVNPSQGNSALAQKFWNQPNRPFGNKEI